MIFSSVLSGENFHEIVPSSESTFHQWLNNLQALSFVLKIEKLNIFLMTEIVKIVTDNFFPQFLSIMIKFVTEKNKNNPSKNQLLDRYM